MSKSYFECDLQIIVQAFCALHWSWRNCL